MVDLSEHSAGRAKGGGGRGGHTLIPLGDFHGPPVQLPTAEIGCILALCDALAFSCVGPGCVTARTSIERRRPIALRGIHGAVVVDAAWEDIWRALISAVAALFWLEGVHGGHRMEEHTIGSIDGSRLGPLIHPRPLFDVTRRDAGVRVVKVAIDKAFSASRLSCLSRDLAPKCFSGGRPS